MQCRICGETDRLTPYRVREMLIGLRESFDYFLCAQCGCLQIAEIPPDMSRYYPADYYSMESHQQVPAQHTGVRRLVDQLLFLDAGLLNTVVSALVRRLRHDAYPVQLMPLTRDAGLRSFDDPVLDVGCGSGDFLFSLRAMGFTCLYGADPFVAEKIVRDGVTIFNTDVGDVDKPGFFRLITFQHSLEHVADQRGTLAAAAKLLRADGMMMVSLPVVESYAWEHYGTDWVDLDAPRHFYLHSLRSLKMVAADAGLVCRSIVPDPSILELLGSEQYRRDIPLRSPDSFMIKGREQCFTAEELARFEALRETLKPLGRAGRIMMYLSPA
ncbi:MAG: hypothetical protein CRU72_04040 [Candidatus Accumulibacter phosphatis]|nr:hypothetical protein [Candidatus Accumulibacter phosphatis]